MPTLDLEYLDSKFEIAEEDDPKVQIPIPIKFKSGDEIIDITDRYVDVSAGQPLDENIGIKVMPSLNDLSELFAAKGTVLREMVLNLISPRQFTFTTWEQGSREASYSVDGAIGEVTLDAVFDEGDQAAFKGFSFTGDTIVVDYEPIQNQIEFEFYLLVTASDSQNNTAQKRISVRGLAFADYTLPFISKVEVISDFNAIEQSVNYQLDIDTYNNIFASADFTNAITSGCNVDALGNPDQDGLGAIAFNIDPEASNYSLELALRLVDDLNNSIEDLALEIKGSFIDVPLESMPPSSLQFNAGFNDSVLIAFDIDAQGGLQPYQFQIDAIEFSGASGEQIQFNTETGEAQYQVVKNDNTVTESPFNIDYTVIDARGNESQGVVTGVCLFASTVTAIGQSYDRTSQFRQSTVQITSLPLEATGGVEPYSFALVSSEITEPDGGDDYEITAVLDANNQMVITAERIGSSQLNAITGYSCRFQVTDSRGDTSEAFISGVINWRWEEIIN